MKKNKIILATYGIGRFPKNKTQHYQELYKILSQKFEIEIIEARNNIKQFSNDRSGEINCSLTEDFIFKDSHRIKKYYKNKFHDDLLVRSMEFNDVHEDNYRSNSNLIQQLLMLQDISNEIKKNNCDYVLSIRDDIFFKPVKLAKCLFKDIDEKTFITSVFHSNCGISERFVFGRKRIICKILKRIDLAEDFMKDSASLSYARTSGLNGEYLMRYCCKKDSLKLLCAPIFTKRYRANGVFARERITLRPKYLIHEWPSYIGYINYLRKLYF